MSPPPKAMRRSPTCSAPRRAICRYFSRPTTHHPPIKPPPCRCGGAQERGGGPLGREGRREADGNDAHVDERAGGGDLASRLGAAEGVWTGQGGALERVAPSSPRPPGRATAGACADDARMSLSVCVGNNPHSIPQKTQPTTTCPRGGIVFRRNQRLGGNAANRNTTYKK